MEQLTANLQPTDSQLKSTPSSRKTKESRTAFLFLGHRLTASPFTLGHGFDL